MNIHLPLGTFICVADLGPTLKLLTTSLRSTSVTGGSQNIEDSELTGLKVYSQASRENAHEITTGYWLAPEALDARQGWVIVGDLVGTRGWQFASYGPGDLT